MMFEGLRYVVQKKKNAPGISHFVLNFLTFCFGDYRNYLYQLNKIGDELSLKNQRDEPSNTPIITLELIEHGTPNLDIEQLLRNESGKHDPIWIADLELCHIIDDICLPKYFQIESIYEASISERAFLYDMIWKNLWKTHRKRTTDAQLRRCLCLK